MGTERSETKEVAPAAFERKRLAKPFAVTTNADEPGTIQGHGAVFDDPHPTSSWALPDDWMDIIRPGAFTDTLAAQAKSGTPPLMLYMHERGNIIGAWREVKEDKDGLFVKGQVHPAAKTDAQVPIYELMKMGAMTGLSIGFCVTKATLDEKSKTREILGIDLAEISPVDIPAGPKARITDVKSRDAKSIHFLETVLRDAGLSRKEAKALLAEGFDALRDAAADPELPQRDADRPGDGSASLAKQLKGFAASLKP